MQNIYIWVWLKIKGTQKHGFHVFNSPTTELIWGPSTLRKTHVVVPCGTYHLPIPCPISSWSSGWSHALDCPSLVSWTWCLRAASVPSWPPTPSSGRFQEDEANSCHPAWQWKTSICFASVCGRCCQKTPGQVPSSHNMVHLSSLGGDLKLQAKTRRFAETSMHRKGFFYNLSTWFSWKSKGFSPQFW